MHYNLYKFCDYPIKKHPIKLSTSCDHEWWYNTKLFIPSPAMHFSLPGSNTDLQPLEGVVQKNQTPSIATYSSLFGLIYPLILYMDIILSITTSPFSRFHNLTQQFEVFVAVPATAFCSTIVRLATIFCCKKITHLANCGWPTAGKWLLAFGNKWPPGLHCANIQARRWANGRIQV